MKKVKNKEHRRAQKKATVLKIILLSLLGLFLAGLICCGVFVGIQISKAPDISTIDPSPEGYLTVILDDEGNKMDSLHITESNRIYVTLDQTPKTLQNAFVAIEDSRFYKHHGIDIRGILRAVGKGITTGKFSQGASTITQQLLKNNVFTGWMDEETFMDKLSRKVQEQYLAVRLESVYSKEWILENYLNTINLGGGTRGVQVASQYYFGKDVSELDLAQCALIAGITKNPSAYNPLKHPDKSLERQALVLDAMLRDGYISQADHDAALNEDVISTLVTDHSDSDQVFDWFEDAMLNQIVADLEEQRNLTEEEAWDLLYTGGLTIYSTENTALQRICETAAQSGEFTQNGEEVSIVVTNVSDGSVAAIVGGSEVKTASLVYDRATDSERQPGSTVKIIGEYAAALDQGLITLGTAYDDAPTDYSDGTAIHNSSGSYDGMITVDQAITDSCNVVALEVFRQVGSSAVMNSLSSFGITTLDEQDSNEALAIGGTYHGVTNLELTAAYNAIAAKGLYTAPYYYTQVLDHEGNVILQNEAASTRVIQQTTADLLTLAMEDVMTDGTGTAAALDGIQTAGKSGTTNDFRDVWFVGFSSQYTCGVWGGYDDNSTQESGTYVKRLWKSVMEQATAGDGTAAALVDTSAYTKATICTKCGKMAVDGLCDDTVQGDTTEVVYFAVGTAPKTACTCHTSVTLCSESGMSAGRWCPEEEQETSVYLKSGTEGTADEDAVAPDGAKETCDIHTFLSTLIPDDEDETETDSPETTSPGYTDPNYTDPSYTDPSEPSDSGDSGGSFWDRFFSGEFFR